MLCCNQCKSKHTPPIPTIIHTPGQKLLPRKCCDNPGTKFRHLICAILLACVSPEVHQGHRQEVETSSLPVLLHTLKNDLHLSSEKTSHFLYRGHCAVVLYWNVCMRVERWSFSLSLSFSLHASLPPTYCTKPQKEQKEQKEPILLFPLLLTNQISDQWVMSLQKTL